MRSVPDSPLPLLTWPIFERLPVSVAVTTREGGVSTGSYASLNLGLGIGDHDEAVRTNRRRAAVAFGVAPESMVFCQQVHGSTARVVDSADAGRGAISCDDAFPNTDAAVTAATDVTLAMMTADCAALVFYDPGTHLLACTHAGWRGLARGVVGSTIEAMVSRGARPRDVVVGIGPTVSPQTYEVGEDVARAAQAALGAPAEQVLQPLGAGKHLFDLTGALRLQLAASGVAPAHIDAAGLTTGPGTPFFSHRAEAPCGRFALLARLLPDGSV